MDNYDDIINHPHHVSQRHPQMSLLSRAAQFAPFAALTGFDEAITETARQTDQQVILEDFDNEQLNSKIAQILQCIDTQPRATVVFFVPDGHKNGGAYQTVTATVKRIDKVERLLVLDNDRPIPFSRIVSIEITRYDE